MGFLFSKNKVPDELPDLKVDELTKESHPKEIKEANSPRQKFQPLPTDHLELPPLPEKPTSNEDQRKPVPLPPKNPDEPHEEQKPSKELPTHDDDQGFFIDTIKNFVEQPENIEDNQLMQGDIVAQMKEYWEKQSPEVILNNVGNELKGELMEKTNKLNNLEKEWQENYFKLLSKEDEIRKEEKELKESLANLIDLYKKTSTKSSAKPAKKASSKKKK